jgi:hypothetical protein
VALRSKNRGLFSGNRVAGRDEARVFGNILLWVRFWVDRCWEEKSKGIGRFEG